MEAEAKQRRQRLAELKKQREGNLKKRELEDEQENMETENEQKITETAEERVKKLLDSTNYENVTASVDITQLAPKKVTWDLERDIEKKKKKLELLTKKAMIRMLKSKLKGTESIMMHELDKENDSDSDNENV